MSNKVTFSIDEISVPNSLASPILKCFLHTVFFLRPLGFQEPDDIEIDHLDITYAAIKDDKLQKEINEKLKVLDDRVMSNRDVKDELVFGVTLNLITIEHQKRWRFVGEEKSNWETWEFKIRIVKKVKKSELRSDVEKRIKMILNKGLSKTQHIPPLNFTSTEYNPQMESRNHSNQEKEQHCPSYELKIKCENDHTNYLGDLLGGFFGKKV